MKLLRLKLNDDFRSLKPGFEITFNSLEFNPGMIDFQPFCFVGLNGSGKSNVLEALSSIFYYLHCCHTESLPSDYLFNETSCAPDAFELEYLIIPRRLNENNDWREAKNQDGWGIIMQHVRIKKEKNRNHTFETKPWFYPWERPQQAGFGEISRNARFLLPEIVVGYSSGENEILSLPFFKTRFLNYDEYVNGVKDFEKYTKPSGNLIYIDNSLSQAVMLTNFLFFDEDVLAPFHDRLGIERITEFRIIIRKKELITLSEIGIERSKPQMGSFQLGDGTQFGSSKETVPITHNLEEQIGKLIKCATCWFRKEVKEDDQVFEELYLDYFLEEPTSCAFQENFESAFDLFQLFQMLISLNLFNIDDITKKAVYNSDSLYVNETIPQPPSDQRVFRFKNFSIQKSNIDYPILSKNLSDGEHQFLHIIGISLLIQNKSALILLDEPETHFNPDWRSFFISTLRQCADSAALEQVMKEESEVDEIYQQMKQSRFEEINMMREILITSHSPFVISDCKQDRVKIFRRNKEKNNDVECLNVDFNTFGTSTNIITNRIFKNEDSIAQSALQRLEHYRKIAELSQLSPELIQSKLNAKLGDSLEKLLLINELVNSKNK